MRKRGPWESPSKPVCKLRLVVCGGSWRLLEPGCEQGPVADRRHQDRLQTGAARRTGGWDSQQGHRRQDLCSRVQPLPPANAGVCLQQRPCLPHGRLHPFHAAVALRLRHHRLRTPGCQPPTTPRQGPRRGEAYRWPTRKCDGTPLRRNFSVRSVTPSCAFRAVGARRCAREISYVRAVGVTRRSGLLQPPRQSNPLCRGDVLHDCANLHMQLSGATRTALS